MRKLLLRPHRDEQGQMAFFMLLMLTVVVMFFAMSLDAGVWYFDHRTAQNQAEAAAMAGVLELPDTSGTDAVTQANTWLAKNYSSSSERYTPGEGSPNPLDSNGDTKLDTLRVCVRRDSGVFFSSLVGITGVNISACATAKIGPASIASVMPWYVAAPDPACDGIGQTCRVDYNYDGDITDPNERTCTFLACPFGLDLNGVYMFKGGGGGNSGAIQACGNGQSNYSECIEGERVSGFYEEGRSVAVELKPGNMGGNTQDALDDRYPSPSINSTCDVPISPTGGLGTAAGAPVAFDAAGKARAKQKFVDNPPHPDCPLRLVTIPIFDQPIPGNGSATVTVLGIAVFGIANWADPGNKTFGASSGADCTQRSGNSVPVGVFDCGMVWGYLFSDVSPPQVLLQQISDTENPFAPLLAALID